MSTFRSTAKSLLWIFLLPLSYLWWAGAILRLWWIKTFRRKIYSEKTIISVGNIHSGGSGKTPLIRELIEFFGFSQSMVLTRGYGGTLKKGELVNINEPKGWLKYGDEPWLEAVLWRVLVWVQKDRVAAISTIDKKFPQVRYVFLEDGYQKYIIHRNVNLLLISTSKSLRDTFCLPLGELREPLSAIARASAVVLVTDGVDGPDTQKWSKFVSDNFREIPVFTAIRKIEGFYQGSTKVLIQPGTCVLGVSGIADPSRFHQDLRSNGVHLFTKVFRDHHGYKRSDVERILHYAKKLGVEAVITTDKDWFKINQYWEKTEIPLYSMRVRYELSETFRNFLKNIDSR